MGQLRVVHRTQDGLERQRDRAAKHSEALQVEQLAAKGFNAVPIAEKGE